MCVLLLCVRFGPRIKSDALKNQHVCSMLRMFVCPYDVPQYVCPYDVILIGGYWDHNHRTNLMRAGTSCALVSGQ